MALDFDAIFPLIGYRSLDENLATCRFYFEDQPDVLQQCTTYITARRDTLVADNRFAWDACRNENDPTTTCCKRHAQTNDMAYDMCVNELVQPHQHALQMKRTFIGGMIFLAIVGIYIVVVVFLRKYSFF